MRQISYVFLHIILSLVLRIGLVSGDKVLVCYWASWSIYRQDEAQFSAKNIPPELCTHIIYSFFGIDQNTYEVMYLDQWADLPDGGGHDQIRKTVDLKISNEKLKVLMGIGGWNEGSRKFSYMARFANLRKVFIESVIQMVEKHKFDGVDMDWEYPTYYGGIPEDKQNFPILLKELRDGLVAWSMAKGRAIPLLTSAFGCAEKKVQRAYDIPEISKYLDYFHLMLYDFKMFLPWGSVEDDDLPNKLIRHHSPLYSKPGEDLEEQAHTSSFAVESYLSKGAPAEKLVFGMGAYAKTFSLFNRSEHDFYDEAAGPGAPSLYSRSAGTSALFEICTEIKQDDWEIRFDEDYKVPYAFSDTKWIGYDSIVSAQIKVDYAMSKGLAGMMVWSLDFDDFSNNCANPNKANFTLISSIQDRLNFHNRDLHGTT